MIQYSPESQGILDAPPSRGMTGLEAARPSLHILIDQHFGVLAVLLQEGGEILG